MDATPTLGQPRVLISRTALLHNTRLLRQTLPEGTKICAMVKADAYGHDAAIVADTLTNFCAEKLEAPAVDCLAVATLDEALALPHVPVPVMVLRPLENIFLGRQRPLLEEALRNGFVLTLATPQAAGDLARIAQAIQCRASIQIMLDTGVAREGTPPQLFPQLLAAIESFPSLKLFGLGTHFVSAEEPDNRLTLDQLRHFTSATESTLQLHPRLLRHAANSGAIFFTPQSHLDMVRPGISLYGIDPTGRPNCDRPLRPAMKWTAPLLLIRDLPQGAAVGYNQTWHASRNTRLGLVPVGYGDGYLRSFSNRAKMVLHGRAVPVIGRVSMDYATIDLTDMPQAAVGDEVIVLDNDPLSPASVYALAQWADTIPYEIFCRIGPRMPRLAVDPAEAPPLVPSEHKTA
jgi:alanine racemase